MNTLRPSLIAANQTLWSGMESSFPRFQGAFGLRVSKFKISVPVGWTICKPRTFNLSPNPPPHCSWGLGWRGWPFASGAKTDFPRVPLLSQFPRRDIALVGVNKAREEMSRAAVWADGCEFGQCLRSSAPVVVMRSALEEDTGVESRS